LRKQTRRKRSHRTTRATCSADKANRSRLDMTGHEARENGLSAWIDRAHQQTEQAHGDGISDQVWRQPCKELETNEAACKDYDKELLTYPWCCVSEDKTP